MLAAPAQLPEALKNSSRRPKIWRPRVPDMPVEVVRPLFNNIRHRVELLEAAHGRKLYAGAKRKVLKPPRKPVAFTQNKNYTSSSTGLTS